MTTTLTKHEKDMLFINYCISENKKGNLTMVAKAKLLNMVNIAYHNSGKIEGCFSIDSTCNGCSFCHLMHEIYKGDITCICNSCYDEKLEKFRANMRSAHLRNLMILSYIEFSEAELSTLNLTGIVRFNSSGDIENVTHATNYIRIAKSNPHAVFTLWAKNVKAVQRAIDNEGKPCNLKLVYSDPIVNSFSDYIPKYFDYKFVVFTPKYMSLVISEFSEKYSLCNGAKCKDCKYKCYLNGHGDKKFIAELLRASKKVIEQIDHITAIRLASECNNPIIKKYFARKQG